MCRLKSGIILKDQVFVPDYDSHTYMLKELGIEDNEINAKTLFVRAELSPINDNIFSDISEWNFTIDQDILPEWFIYDYDKQRMVEAVKEWTESHVFENVDNLELKGEGKYYLKNCKNVKAYDNCEIIAYGNCTINEYGKGTVYAFKNSEIIAYDNCKVIAYGNCKVYAFENSEIKAYDNCNVESYDNCIITVYDECIVEAFENGIVYAYDNCTIYVYNDDEDNVNSYAVEVRPHDDCKIINVGN